MNDNPEQAGDTVASSRPEPQPGLQPETQPQPAPSGSEQGQRPIGPDEQYESNETAREQGAKPPG